MFRHLSRPPRRSSKYNCRLGRAKVARRRLERRIPEGQLRLFTSVNANLEGDDRSFVDVAA